MPTAQIDPGPPRDAPRQYASHRPWRARFAGQALADLELLASIHGTRTDALRAAATDLARWVDDSLAGKPLIWRTRDGARAVGPNPLRAGAVDPGPQDTATWVHVVTTDHDRSELARFEVALAHANEERPSLAALLRVVAQRGAELERARAAGLYLSLS